MKRRESPRPVIAAAVLAIALTAGGVAAFSLAARSAEPPGKAALDGFLRREVASIADASLARIRAPGDWPLRREELRRELLDMLGLLPEPPRGDLRTVNTGTLERPDLGVAVEKLHFQSVPGLYVTGNLWRPLAASARLPAVLYLCGHGQVKVDGISCGNKAFYQHHPAWFARNGYVCLVIDTLQLGEIEGVHHGTYRLNEWWWVSRGYTPAGVEAWGSIRALDLLAARPDVDAARIGVTGRSGGGIGTWWLAALDDRPAALVPVAGLTDLRNHIIDGCIDGHCDCNFPVNFYRWDHTLVAALAAPRPLLLGNSDKDTIFPLDGVQRVHGMLRGLYGALGAPDRLGLLIVEGPHADTQELQVPAFRWMDRWLRNLPNRTVEVVPGKPVDPKDLKVLAEIPSDQRDTSIQESFVAAAPMPPVPASMDELGALRTRLLGELRALTFRSQPEPVGPPSLEAVEDRARDGVRIRIFRLATEEPFLLPLVVAMPVGEKRPHRVILVVAGEEGWRGLGDPAAEEALAAAVRGGGGAALAVFPPRGIGPTRWSDEPKAENGIRRRLLAIGRVLDETRIFDVRRALRAIGAIDDLAGVPITVRGEGEMAGIALYAALLEPSAVESVDLEALAASHREGPILLGVLRVLDIPQAVALLFPRKVMLRGVPPESFGWTRRAAETVSKEGRGSPLEIVPARDS